MKMGAVLTESIADAAADHLLRDIRRGRRQEDLCFALWSPSTGAGGTTAIISELLLPQPGERHLHGNVSFEPGYLARAVREACKHNAGVAFMHSHPTTGWQNMSREDVVAERDRIAGPARASGLPLVGLTVGRDGIWSARFWCWTGQRFEHAWCEKVRIVGRRGLQLSLRPGSEAPRPTARLRRTVDTWGEQQQFVLASLRVGIVGLGSVGCVVAEALARIGVTDVLLVDADRVEEHNLDRLLYADPSTVGRFKVDLAAEELRRRAVATRFRVKALRAWIQERDAFREALDCDLLFAAVDRPLPKDLLNHIAYAHGIPVVFGGIRVATKPDGRFGEASWSVVRATPGSRCLRCDGQYSTSDVTMERDGSLDDPTYVQVGDRQPDVVGNQNVFPFSASLGSLMVLEMLRSILREDWWPPTPSKIHYTYVTGRLAPDAGTCHANCSVTARLAQGDRASYPFLDEPVQRSQPASRRARTKRGALPRWAGKLGRFFERRRT